MEYFSHVIKFFIVFLLIISRRIHQYFNHFICQLLDVVTLLFDRVKVIFLQKIAHYEPQCINLNVFLILIGLFDALNNQFQSDVES